MQQLGRVTDGLTLKQKELGDVIRRQMGTLAPSTLAALNRDYEKVGRTIDQLKRKQDKLTASIARGEVLKSQRADLRGQFMETAGTGAALGAPLALAGRTAMEFKDRTNDIAITGGFSADEEAQLSNTLRASALKWNQTQMDMAAGAQVLIAGGISNVQELAAYAPVMAKAATATRASMDDLGAVAIALNDNLKIGASGLERSMNMLAFAGKSGQFELADMARWLPQLTPQFAALGVTGEKAVAEIGASLQIARRGAGTNDEAANNFKNFLSKLTAKDTLKSFKDAGIDLQTSMQNLVAKGLTPVQAMLEVVTHYVGSKGPAAANEFKKAMALKDATESQAAMARLSEAYKLGDLFADQQVLSFLRPALANRADLASIQQGSVDAADKGGLDADWKKRMESPKEQFKALTNNLSELGITVGSVLLPALVDVTQAAIPVVKSFATWAGENPELIKGIVGLVGGLLAGKLAFIGVAYGANLVISPFVAIATTITGLSAKLSLLKVMWQVGKFTPFISGVRLAGQAVLWLGRALMLNPIGLLITAIAIGAYLIYRYWEPIKGFFTGLWDEVRAGFNGGLSGIAATILNFSPLGMFYRAFAGVMNYFGVEMPGQFSEFGTMVISGLVDGMTAKLSAAKETVVNFGASIKGWFTETLGIQSPSRVFMGYGANISEGAALGITAEAGLVRKAAMDMAAGTQVPMRAPDMAAVSRAATMAGGAGGGMTVHFSPTIQVQGSGDAGNQVRQAMAITFPEFERLMQRYQQGMARRSYGDI
ncbi:phage tail tape measure protein [Metapseudomonas otitidis]|uniref:phage tail tape measure protein n=1 Tax=Metapseudomonas otitidis TaxID=319939 RepID=UPI001F266742|nr:phage tail tape measure protein [Pseudomonas otitidis]